MQLTHISNFIDNLPSAWKAVAAIVAILSLIVGISGGVRAGLQVPAKLDAHMIQADTIISELRKLNAVTAQNQCIAISPKPLWLECLRAK